MKEPLLTKSGKLGIFYCLFLALSLCCFFSCSDDDSDSGSDAAYDPSKEVTITDFVPKDGGVGQKLVVYGTNFGNDTSQVKVYIGGKRATLINVKGNSLYCFVPSGAYDGDIQVMVGDEGSEQTAIAADSFAYERKMVVGTLCGYRNERDDQGWHDGPFATCSGFRNAGCMAWDPLYPNRLYVVYDNNGPGIQLLDMEAEELSTVMSNSTFENRRLRNLAFSLDGKYLFVSTDRDDRQTNSPSVWIVERNSDGTFSNNSSHQVIASYKQCNGVSVHPVNGEIYFNSYENGQVFRLDFDRYLEAKANGETWNPSVVENEVGAFEQLFTIQDVSYEFQIDIHPSGKYAYIVVINKHYILRSDYNESTHKFAPPYVVAGALGQTGWYDAVGTDARLNKPYQGVFVKNPEYVSEGREDIYDFYFCDNQNHCIRKLTPDGIVTTYAGRGSSTAATDNNVWGTDDGDLREVARFRDPTGLAYDETNNIFYILDTVGRKIRTISMEGEE